MVTNQTNCENCIHNKICSIKNKVKEAKGKASTEFSNYNELISISIRCTEFNSCFNLVD